MGKDNVIKLYLLLNIPGNTLSTGCREGEDVCGRLSYSSIDGFYINDARRSTRVPYGVAEYFLINCARNWLMGRGYLMPEPIYQNKQPFIYGWELAGEIGVFNTEIEALIKAISRRVERS